MDMDGHSSMHPVVVVFVVVCVCVPPSWSVQTAPRAIDHHSVHVSEPAVVIQGHLTPQFTHGEHLLEPVTAQRWWSAVLLLIHQHCPDRDIFTVRDIYRLCVVTSIKGMNWSLCPHQRDVDPTGLNVRNCKTFHTPTMKYWKSLFKK